MIDVRRPAIKEFILAGYPCLFMQTVEPQVAESRVRAGLSDLKMTDMDFGVWKVTTGLLVGRVDGVENRREEAKDLIDALAVLEKRGRPMVGVFHNLRQFVSNYQIIQQMIDTIFAIREKGSHLILVGPHLELPPELKPLVTYVDCPLPTQAQILEEYRKFARAYEADIQLPESKEEREDLLKAAANAAVGLDMMGAENAIALSLATAETVDLPIIQAQKEQEVRKSDVLEFISMNESMNSLGGYKGMKDWLSRRRKAFTEEAREYGLPYPKGMLIVGPAGTGKSLCAKAVAHYLQLPLLRLDMGKVFRSLVGESEAAIRMALQVAEAVSPVVMWLDEIEKGLAGMRGSGELDSGVTARVVSTILTWRQETTYPVLLVATANDVASIPSMVYRKGRLDEVWATDLPTEEEREEIFEIHLRKRKRDPDDFDCALLAVNSEDSTGSEIEGCIGDAMFSAFDRGDEVSTSYILSAIRETVPQAQRDKEEVQAIREWVSTRARLVAGGNKPKPKFTGDKVRKIRSKRSKK